MKPGKPFSEPVVLLDAPFLPNVPLMRAALAAGDASRQSPETNWRVVKIDGNMVTLTIEHSCADVVAHVPLATFDAPPSVGQLVPLTRLLDERGMLTARSR